ncbi:MAG: oxygen-dependent coproporphyrinogen oxidase [Bacteroidota bacterium]
MKNRTAHFFKELQHTICAKIEELDGKARFHEDAWTHIDGGGGKTRIIQNGNVFEKCGVNFSRVDTKISEKLAEKMKIDQQRLYATGISLVLHPSNPFVPTVHMNLRYLELENGDRWFGGGTDLTPWYLFEEDARHFHSTLKSSCDKHDPTYYPGFKRMCDMYFYLKHRDETRGIGGIFFDYQRENPEAFFTFVQDVGNSFLLAYMPIVEKRKNLPWNPKEKEWQLIRRGRYVEFNLIYDRGTLFGLETGGRAESILMSLPPDVKWAYNYSPQPGTREAELISVLRHPKEWV